MKKLILLILLGLNLNVFSQKLDLSGNWYNVTAKGSDVIINKVQVTRIDDYNYEVLSFIFNKNSPDDKKVFYNNKAYLKGNTLCIINPGNLNSNEEFKLEYKSNNIMSITTEYESCFCGSTSYSAEEYIRYVEPENPTVVVYTINDNSFNTVLKAKEKQKANTIANYQITTIKKPCSNKLKSLVLPNKIINLRDSVAVIMLSIIDNNISDSDKVTLFVDDDKILSNVSLFTNLEYNIPISIEKDKIVTYFACNQGEYSLNTGTIYIKQYKDNILIDSLDITMNLKTGEEYSLYFKK